MKAKPRSINTGLALVLAALLITTLLVGAPRVAHAFILSDSLIQPSYSIDNLAQSGLTIPGYTYKGAWIAQSFSTGIGANTAYILNSVTLAAWHDPDFPLLTPTVQLSLYSNTGGIPGVTGLPNMEVGSLTSPSSFSTTPGDTALFTATGLINLNPNTYYWIVGQPLTGSLVWTYAPDNGHGSGFQPGWAGKSDGTSWDMWGDGITSSNPGSYMMRVEATPIPAPATLLLFGSGLLGLVGLRRRTRS